MPAPALAVLVLALAAPAPDRATLVRDARTRLAEAERALAEERYQEAAAAFVAVRERLATAGTPNLLVARATDGLADAMRATGRPDEAEILYLEAADAWVALLGERQPRLATTLHDLGLACLDQGKRAEAQRHLARALLIWEATLGTDSAEARSTRHALARARAAPR